MEKNETVIREIKEIHDIEKKIWIALWALRKLHEKCIDVIDEDEDSGWFYTLVEDNLDSIKP